MDNSKWLTERLEPEREDAPRFDLVDYAAYALIFALCVALSCWLVP